MLRKPTIIFPKYKISTASRKKRAPLLKKDNKILTIDIKPSDAIALAIRFSAPVYIKTDLLRQEGRNIC